MKNSIFTMFALLSLFISNAQNVNIPDAVFKTALLNHQPVIDTNSDGEIQVNEALATTSLVFNGPNNLNYINGNIQNTTGLESFTNLNSLTFRQYPLASWDLSALTSLQHLDCSRSNYLTTLNVSALTNLQTLDCSSGGHLNSLNLNGLINLQTLDCSFCSLATLDLTGLTGLTFVDSHQNLSISSIVTTGANNITHFNCSQGSLLSLLVTGMTNLQYLDCGAQFNLAGVSGITSLDLTGLNNLTYLSCNWNELTSLDVSHLTNLTYLNCNRNHIPVLNVTALTNLTFLNCSNNLIANLNVTPLTNLTYLDCGYNQIPSLDLAPLVNLTTLYCSNNLLPTISLNTLTALTQLDCSDNPIHAINLTNNTNLTWLYCGNNQLTTLSIGNLVNLATLYCAGNQLTTLDVSNLHHLTSIRVDGNLFTTLDFSQSILPIPNYVYISVNYSFGNCPNLTYVNLKNGVTMSYGNVTAIDSPNLQYICADESSIQAIQHDIAMNASYSTTPANVQVNSYCNFVPGGVHNTISGTVTLDNNNNGCDVNDIHPRDFKININDGVQTGATFSTANGGYSFFTQSGNFTLTPQFENPYFIASPANSIKTFATLDGSTQTQDYCLTANGVHNDVEITIIPASNARPGFDAVYLLTYKNKGNQILAGNINVTFDDGVLDFITATPMIDSQSLNNLGWNYTNLLPFESRMIYFTLNLNSPTDTPPVNINDVLNFNTTINPIAGDETTNDNTFSIAQLVGGSFDPNDKICLEGNTITPSMVGGYLNYVIRFQNTGTFYAENVVVKDVIDSSKFDINSLQLVASSHPHNTRISGNKVEFIFENINLPAQTDNEPGSHGFVAFKIKTKSNLALGNQIQNTANIYFDFNAPVITKYYFYHCSSFKCFRIRK
ncbi:leucine-rich repeat domain-containing protein [Flavobacterium sp. N1994]|uniref:DUF7619 domain-containing protein n=1 Tax=Flavobacterium sp. N1994 TaxID=2986827 RepID=UPI002222AC90|nr:leucine-rich repeat domain-containing protein [Flavobacterium sp. N1994]